MNPELQKQSVAVRIGTIPLLVILLVGASFAGLFPRTALAQRQKDSLSLRLLSNDYYTEITAGETKVLLLEVKNRGSNAIDGIVLSAIPPEDWTVDLEPARITSLNPADSLVVKVTVKTPSRSERERREVILRADSAAVHRATSAWLTVEPPEGRWLWIGGILAVSVVAVFVIIFLRFGRD